MIIFEIRDHNHYLHIYTVLMKLHLRMYVFQYARSHLLPVTCHVPDTRYMTNSMQQINIYNYLDRRIGGGRKTDTQRAREIYSLREYERDEEFMEAVISTSSASM